ncbi:hypothetical protein F4821DRAFT_240530, partial [Hypoxylon rubiginosum]
MAKPRASRGGGKFSVTILYLTPNSLGKSAFWIVWQCANLKILKKILKRSSPRIPSFMLPSLQLHIDMQAGRTRAQHWYELCKIPHYATNATYQEFHTPRYPVVWRTGRAAKNPMSLASTFALVRARLSDLSRIGPDNGDPYNTRWVVAYPVCPVQPSDM